MNNEFKTNALNFTEEEFNIALQRMKHNHASGRSFIDMTEDITSIEANWNDFRNKIAEELEDGYEPKAATPIQIPKRNGKRKTVYLSLEDEFVLNLLVGRLYPAIYEDVKEFQGHYCFDTELNSPEEQTHWIGKNDINEQENVMETQRIGERAKECEEAAVFVYDNRNEWNKFREELRKRKPLANECFLSIDLKNCYNSIQHDLLKESLEKIPVDQSIVELLMKMLSAWSLKPGRGIPMGYESLDILVKHCLVQVDKALIAEGYDFTRYLDDYVFFGFNKNYQRDARYYGLKKIFKTHGLKMNKHKTKCQEHRVFLKQYEKLDDLKREISCSPIETDKGYLSVDEKYDEDFHDDTVNYTALCEEFKKRFGSVDDPDQTRVFFVIKERLDFSIIHFLLSRLAMCKSNIAEDFCVWLLKEFPHETLYVVHYFNHIRLSERTIKAIEKIVRKRFLTVPYQVYLLINFCHKNYITSKRMTKFCLKISERKDEVPPYLLQTVDRFLNRGSITLPAAA